MFVAQPLQDGQGRSCTTPLKSYACEVEGYQSIDIAISHGKSDAERRQLSHYASRAYELATHAFAWLFLILLLLTLASHVFSFPSTGAHAGSPPEQDAAPLVLGASTLPNASPSPSQLWKKMQARHWVPSVAPSDVSKVAPTLPSARQLLATNTLEDKDVVEALKEVVSNELKEKEALKEEKDYSAHKLARVNELEAENARLREQMMQVMQSTKAAPAEQQPVCEDADPLECARLFAAEAQQFSADSSGLTPLPSACSPRGSGTAAARCPRSCGLCAVVLADCHHVAVFNEGSCVEGDDVVGEVCSGDGDMKKEAYCTWLPTNTTATKPANGNNRLNIAALTPPRRFVCAHCVDVKMSPERRAMMAQMLELRIEEDGREASRSKDALENNAASVAERDAVVVHR